ncbi:MAG TPA: DNA cytosine methyltransferase [Actinomycetes bacterium]|jgi:DNA (cytosine-5)-methyltransferase 1|nr:DNA cytosine methyltransferase [Actinomycetes bacterium]
MTRTVVDLFAGGPSGWEWAARALDIDPIGFELDPWACATRAAAGLRTVRADVARLPVGHLAGRVWGVVASPPCQQFSAAGSGAGRHVEQVLASAIVDALRGRRTLARRRREMARALQAAGWPDWKLPRAERSRRAWAAVRNAALVVQPARWVAATRPEWVCMEQVPAVLGLWRVYAAELRRLSYSAWAGVLNSADYGVPQTRERAILIASRVGVSTAPAPSHARDPQPTLFGTLERWVSMAEALGWAGAVETEQTSEVAAGRVPHLVGTERPALAVVANADRWLVRTTYGQPRDHPKNGSHLLDPHARPAHAVTSKARNWTVRTGINGMKHSRDVADLEPYERPIDQPAPTVHQPQRWRVAPEGGHRPTPQEWRLRSGNQPKATQRPLGEPAPTLAFGHNSARVQWADHRPATTVQGDPRVGRPGHKQREHGEGQFEADAVRITVPEALVLQGFPPDLSVQGTKTAQFTQVGNAIPPQLALAVLGQVVPAPEAGQVPA